MKYTKIFVLGFLQVILLTFQTCNIVNTNYPMIFVTSFFISLVWANNVIKVSRGSKLEIMFYCFGASLGAVSGTLLGGLIN